MLSTSIPVKRDHRRPKTDRLDCELMMRAFLEWLRREEGHCRMVAVPTCQRSTRKFLAKRYKFSPTNVKKEPDLHILAFERTGE